MWFTGLIDEEEMASMGTLENRSVYNILNKIRLSNLHGIDVKFKNPYTNLPDMGEFRVHASN
jgi:hypothetical protein